MNQSWPDIMALALAAHHSGIPWTKFWPKVAEDVRRLQALCPDAHLRLYHRLMALCVSGDDDGQQPPIGFELEAIEQMGLVDA